jgi:SPX domain protein involved in polyphosphate accumulation
MREAKEKFGHFSTFMVHDGALYEEIPSALLKRQGSLVSQQSRPPFLDLFEAELSRFTEYVVGQHAHQERSAKALLANAFTLVEDSTTETSSHLLQGLRHQADEQLQTCLLLRRFSKKNAETLTEVAQCADQQLGTTCVILLLHQKRQLPGADSGLPVVFGDIYATLHAAETKQQVTDDKWVAPSSLERTTIKYWVKEDHLAEVLLLTSTKAPLLVYGRTGRLTTKEDCLLRQSEGNNQLWNTSLVTPISSVYFDSSELDLYSSRIVRDEGSQLLRVRWYGSKPQGKEPIFVELKTHHEKWINSKSV